MADQVIGYRVPHPQPPERLTLEDGADFVRITFPVAPTWVYVINPSICAALAAAWTFGPVIVVFRFWRTHGMFPVAPLLRYPWHFFWVFALRLWVGPSILWIFAILDWRKYRKWGRVPRVLTASKQGVTSSHLGWFGMKQKFWPASEITDITLKPLKWNLHPTSKACDLTIHRAGTSSISYRFSSKNRAIAEQVVERFRQTIGAGT